MKKTFIISTVILIILGICVTGLIKLNTGDTYLVQMKLYYKERYLFKNYDIDIYIDNKKLDTLDPDTTKIYDLELKSGVHTLTISKEDDESIDGNTDFTVTENLQLDYTITPQNQQVKIVKTDEIIKEKTFDK